MSAISGATSLAGQRRLISSSRAEFGSLAWRMMRITSSICATAMARPTSTWARSRALASRNLVRRVTTSSRKATKAASMSLSFIVSGRPPFSATTLAPNEVCSAEKRQSWLSTTSAMASRFSSITTRMPSRSLSSRMSAMPSMRLSCTISAIFSIIVALLTWNGISWTTSASRSRLHRLHRHLPAHHDRAAPGLVGRADAGAAEDDAAGGKIRTGDEFHQLLGGQRRVVDQRHGAVDHLAEIVRRDVGRHADGDAAAAIHQQVREARRQHHRLALGAVVIVAEIDRVLVDVLGHRMGDLGAPRLGVAHRRRRIAVDRAEVPLPVDQRHAHGEVLRHAHQRVVDRLVAVRVILAHHVADDQRALAIGLVPVAAVLVHRIEDAAMHGLEPVAHVGQRAADDHAHGVIEIAAAHLVGDRDRFEFGGLALAGIAAAGGRSLISQNGPGNRLKR